MVSIPLAFLFKYASPDLNLYLALVVLFIPSFFYLKKTFSTNVYKKIKKLLDNKLVSLIETEQNFTYENSTISWTNNKTQLNIQLKEIVRVFELEEIIIIISNHNQICYVPIRVLSSEQKSIITDLISEK